MANTIMIELTEQEARVLTNIGWRAAGASSTPEGNTADPEATIRYLISSVMDGVRRPGSWERQVLYSLFGDGVEAAEEGEWLERLKAEKAAQVAAEREDYEEDVQFFRENSLYWFLDHSPEIEVWP